MFTCIIIDDNESVLDNLRLVFSELYPDKIKIVGMANSAEKGIELIAKNMPDVLFLDAHMPNMGGMSVISHLYQKHIYKGIETIKVLLYTGKTEVYETIVGSELKYPTRILNKGIQTIEDYGKLIDETSDWLAADRAIKTLKIDNQNLYVGDIQYFKSSAPVTGIYINDKANPLISGYPLAHYKSKIGKELGVSQPLPAYFFYATNDCIINRLFVSSYSSDEVFLKNGLVVPISRSQRAAFENWWLGR